MTNYRPLIGKAICVRDQQGVLYEGILKAFTQNGIAMLVTAIKQPGVDETGRENHWVYNRKKKKEYKSLTDVVLVGVEVQLELGVGDAT